MIESFEASSQKDLNCGVTHVEAVSVALARNSYAKTDKTSVVKTGLEITNWHCVVSDF